MNIMRLWGISILLGALLPVGVVLSQVYTLENDTTDYLFIAYVRTKPRTGATKLFIDSSYTHDVIVIYAVPPVRTATITIDQPSKQYDRALWVAGRLGNLVADLMAGQVSRRSAAMIDPAFTHGIALDTRATAGYLFFTAKGFSIASSRANALAAPINSVGRQYELFDAAVGRYDVDRYRLGDLKGSGLGRVEPGYTERSERIKEYLRNHEG